MGRTVPSIFSQAVLPSQNLFGKQCHGSDQLRHVQAPGLTFNRYINPCSVDFLIIFPWGMCLIKMSQSKGPILKVYHCKEGSEFCHSKEKGSYFFLVKHLLPQGKHGRQNWNREQRATGWKGATGRATVAPGQVGLPFSLRNTHCSTHSSKWRQHQPFPWALT